MQGSTSFMSFLSCVHYTNPETKDGREKKIATQDMYRTVKSYVLLIACCLAPKERDLVIAKEKGQRIKIRTAHPFIIINIPS